MINVVAGATGKPVATGELRRVLENATLDGEMTTGFPIVVSESRPFAVDALLVSPDFGVLAFDIVEGTDLGDIESRQDDLIRVLTAKLFGHRELVSRRKLVPEVRALTYAPALSDESVEQHFNEDYPVANTTGVVRALRQFGLAVDQAVVYDQVRSAIQNLASLNKIKSAREPVQPDSRGARLKDLEKSIATLDTLQRRAVVETAEGVQRIRGLAGSGKTVVLALKAAYLHAQFPDWRIAVTFNTRSLKDQFKRLISSFYIDQTGTDPDWTRLRILNAWGGAGSDPERGGVYSEFCDLTGATFWNYGQAARNFTSARAFESVCNVALDEAKDFSPAYDAILVDEAQDLPPSFLRMCYLLLREPKRLVYAYDELQILTGRGLPGPDEIFGLRDNGDAVVEFDTVDGRRRDIVLEKCYRNSRPVLVTAHAIGFGIYREPPTGQTTGLVQLFENAHLWEDIGYHVDRGPLEENNDVALARTAESSPPFLEKHSPLDDLIHFQSFQSAAEQNDWVAANVVANLERDELRHDDIVVINPNGISARKNLAPLRAALLEQGVDNHHAGVDTSADVFFSREKESVTVTGIYRAKGNEAGMVYIVNAEEGMDAVYNLSSVRNALFTAITRSKGWVRVLGVGPRMDELIAEYEKAKAADFKLAFRYPTEAEREKLNLLHREVTPEQAEAITQRKVSVKEFLDDLEEGRIFPEDLDPELITRLLSRLDRDKD
ncbi:MULTISPECIES: DEAD/DEAH box helicase [unclassified Curtobacterium]|uniref:DEAD/DEAH box helicase n=1 Tax=unclassified Curtobacterium TaxID=257496 RepID=UPI003A80477D